MTYKDGFVIEYANQGSRISCYKCVFFNKHDRACDKVGVYVPDVARVEWKTCKFFELDDDYNTEEMRAKAERIRVRAMEEERRREASKKKASRGMGQPAKGSQTSDRDGSDGTQNSTLRKPSDGPEAIEVGSVVRSPRHGRGKVIEIDGEWIVVVFSKDSKRVRINLATSLKNGSLTV